MLKPSRFFWHLEDNGNQWQAIIVKVSSAYSKKGVSAFTNHMFQKSSSVQIEASMHQWTILKNVVNTFSWTIIALPRVTIVNNVGTKLLASCEYFVGPLLHIQFLSVSLFSQGSSNERERCYRYLLITIFISSSKSARFECVRATAGCR